MAFTRYATRGLIVNDKESYREAFFDQRDIQKLVQFDTARFYYPTFQERGQMALSTLTWSATSKLYNLANEFYGDPRLWWLIAWFNQKPTEAHFKVGDVFYVPSNLTEVLDFFERSNGDV
jgi:hypothetical protein